MDSLIDILSKADWTIILSVLAMFWIFNNRLDKKFDELKLQINKLDEKLTDVDRRLCRMEGAMTSKDCCMLKDERQIRKAE